MGKKRVAVIGGGVIGLSTALRLLESCPGVSVTVIAETYTPDTTGDTAAGFCQPYALGDTPQAKISKWGSETFRHLLNLANQQNASQIGTFLVFGYDIFRTKKEEPFWKDMVLGYRLMTKGELDLFPDYGWGYAYTTVVAESRKYLPWLMKCIAKCGGKFEVKRVNSFNEVSEYDVVVNCTGIGAKDLAWDQQLIPVKGQVIRVEAPWIKHFLNADDEDLHILLGEECVVLGGVQEIGDGSLEIDENQTRRIVDRCTRLVPSLKGAKILNERTGLRPSRSSVRIEVEDYITTNNRKIIKVVHNYGHGGGGITLHWGCAKEALDLVLKELNDAKNTSNL